MYGDPLLIHILENCLSKKVWVMLAKCAVEPHLAGKLFQSGIEAQHAAATQLFAVMLYLNTLMEQYIEIMNQVAALIHSKSFQI